jgi:hypothetical protein
MCFYMRCDRTRDFTVYVAIFLDLQCSVFFLVRSLDTVFLLFGILTIGLF